MTGAKGAKQRRQKAANRRAALEGAAGRRLVEPEPPTRRPSVSVAEWHQYQVRKHDGVLVQSSGQSVTEVDGWRYFVVRQQNACLYSPHGRPETAEKAAEHYGTRRRLSPWESPHYTPTCPVHNEHIPPVPSCLCGVYFSPFLLDVLGMADQLRIAAEQKADLDPAGLNLAVCHVKMTGPVIMQYDDGGMVEGRAAAASIEKIWVLPEWLQSRRDRQGRPRLAAALKKRYGAPVEFGRPEYTDDDAHHPAALRIERERHAG